MILAVDRKRMLVAGREPDEIAGFEAHIEGEARPEARDDLYRATAWARRLRNEGVVVPRLGGSPKERSLNLLVPGEKRGMVLIRIDNRTWSFQFTRKLDTSAPHSARAIRSRFLEVKKEKYPGAGARLRDFSDETLTLIEDAYREAASRSPQQAATLPDIRRLELPFTGAYVPADEAAANARYRDPFRIDPEAVDRGNLGHIRTQSALGAWVSKRVHPGEVLASLLGVESRRRRWRRR